MGFQKLKGSKKVIWGKYCPTNPSHGLLLPIHSNMTNDAWVCPSAQHTRSKPPTKSTFTDEEADGKPEAPRSGGHKGNLLIELHSPTDTRSSR